MIPVKKESVGFTAGRPTSGNDYKSIYERMLSLESLPDAEAKLHDGSYKYTVKERIIIGRIRRAMSGTDGIAERALDAMERRLYGDPERTDTHKIDAEITHSEKFKSIIGEFRQRAITEAKENPDDAAKKD